MKLIYKKLCLRCPRPISVTKKYQRYCNICFHERLRENQKTGTLVRRIKANEKRVIMENALSKGKRLSAKEIKLLTGYKNTSTVEKMIYKSDLNIKRAYMYYLDPEKPLKEEYHS